MTTPATPPVRAPQASSRHAELVARSTHGQGRVVPDVATNADPVTGYQVVIHGHTQVVRGIGVVTLLYASQFAAFGAKLGFITQGSTRTRSASMTSPSAIKVRSVNSSRSRNLFAATTGKADGGGAFMIESNWTYLVSRRS